MGNQNEESEISNQEINSDQGGDQSEIRAIGRAIIRRKSA
jgi:hypothetical protein